MLVNDGNGRNGNVSTSAMETKSVIGNVDYNRIRQSASILQGVAATDNLNESNTISNLINIDLTGVSRQHDGYLDDTIAKYDNQGSMGLELENANNDLNMLISNSNEIADSWEDLDTNTPGNVHSGLQKIDEILGLEGDSSLGNMYSSTSTDDIAFYTNALAVEGFISGSAYLSDYYPSLEYRTKATWAAELIQKYQDQGYSEEDARELANLEMVETAIEATGGESHEQALSDIESLRENYEIEGTSQDTETEETPSEELQDTEDKSTSESTAPATSTASSSSGSSSSSSSGTYQYRTQSYSASSNSGASTGSVIGSSSNSGGTSSSAPSSNTPPTETPSTSGETSTPSETPSTPETSTPSGENNGTSGPSIDEEVPTEETPSTGENTNTGDNNSGTTTTPPPTNTGESNTNTSPSTPPSSGNNNAGYVPFGNNNNNGNVSNAGGSFEDPGTPDTNVETPNENVSTTTPSAPDSDAGIKDNSGETLDVISIDKDTTNSPSTSSNDGGSVIPAVLGVGVAGAAVAGGAKIIHDKKNKDEMYSYDDEESEEDNNSFSYLNSYDDSSETETQETPATKYRAGSANKLVLEDAPENINIEESATNIPGSGEELE